MAKCTKLLDAATINPAGLRIAEAASLAECWGFVERRSAGGAHRVFKRPGFRTLLNFQPEKNGMAKRYQVRQLLDAIQELQDEGVTPQ
jgi:hypothetical protein